MKRYCIKSREGRIEHFDIISETDDGFNIKITRLRDGDEKIVEEFMSKALFDMCKQTGYIFETEDNSTSIA